MSEALSPEALDAGTAAPSVEDPAPVDAETAAVGSAGVAEPKVVDAKRFDGLMSAHQRALAELQAEREARVALEARITSQETHEVADDTTLDEVRQLRAELAAERLEAAKQRVLTEFPDAAPLADLITGSNETELRAVAQAVAQRLAGMKAPDPLELGTTEAETATETETNAATDAAPVVAGGTTAPATPSANEAVQAALEAKDWNAFWQAKSSRDVAALG